MINKFNKLKELNAEPSSDEKKELITYGLLYLMIFNPS